MAEVSSLRLSYSSPQSSLSSGAIYRTKDTEEHELPCL